VDANGSAIDGLIAWNFAYPYAYGDSASIPDNSYDFTSVALHELLHTLGILSAMEGPSNANTNWLTYDKFLAAADGTRVVGDNYLINSNYLSSFTGSNGGIFFGGPNAVAAYGGLVPVYTPGTWSSGASLSHLDEDNVNGDEQIMNAWLYYGSGPREIGDVELGILKDLGYTIVSDTPSPGSGSAIAAFGLLAFRLLRRRR
jgi:MYXO-CTERM domain-containing protein